MSNETLGIDCTGTWTPRQYVIDAGWDFGAIQSTAHFGLAEPDKEGLTTAQATALYNYCLERATQE